jgi:hypothetical protein
MPLRALQSIFGDHPALATEGIISQIVQLDWIGTVIVLGGERASHHMSKHLHGIGITSLTLALVTGGGDGWSNHTVIIGFVTFGVAIILLVVWELVVMKGQGMVPLRVAKFRGVWGAAGVAFTRMISS